MADRVACARRQRRPGRRYAGRTCARTSRGLRLVPQFRYLIGSRRAAAPWAAWHVLSVRRSTALVDHIAYTVLIDPTARSECATTRRCRRERGTRPARPDAEEGRRDVPFESKARAGSPAAERAFRGQLSDQPGRPTYRGASYRSTELAEHDATHHDASSTEPHDAERSVANRFATENTSSPQNRKSWSVSAARRYSTAARRSSPRFVARSPWAIHAAARCDADDSWANASSDRRERRPRPRRGGPARAARDRARAARCRSRRACLRARR